MESKGFIKIDRNLLKHGVWYMDVFSKGQAWIDLLLNAHFEDGNFYSKKGLIYYKRGDCTFSIANLMRRWQWGRWKVRHFLEILEENGMITKHYEKGTYLCITIKNYEKYQGKINEKKSNKNKLSKEEQEKLEIDRELRFVLQDEYDEYMENKKRG